MRRDNEMLPSLLGLLFVLAIGGLVMFITAKDPNRPIQYVEVYDE
jgi:hypothetical protein